MSLVRIIPRLDIKGPNVVKGLCYDGYRVLGHPETFAQTYFKEGADELFFQDTVASLYKRNNLLEIIRKTAEKVQIPITVCGGVRSLDDIKSLLRSGADKVAINTAAISNPSLIEKAAKMFGSQCIVASIEAPLTKGFPIILLGPLLIARTLLNERTPEPLVVSACPDVPSDTFNSSIPTLLSLIRAFATVPSMSPPRAPITAPATSIVPKLIVPEPSVLIT